MTSIEFDPDELDFLIRLFDEYSGAIVLDCDVDDQTLLEQQEDIEWRLDRKLRG